MEHDLARRLLIATTNPGKIREFRQILGEDQFRWRDLSNQNDAPVEETGRTFEENASLKASHYAKLFNMLAVADDSGLEVDALDGSPGIYSARWAEMNHAGKGDADNNALLIRQLANVPEERCSARFVCVLAVANMTGQVLTTVRDTIEGRILRAPRGNNGFGYDPLFFVESEGRTTAELSPEAKHRISHRGKALRQLREWMQQTKLVETSKSEKQGPL